MIWFLVGLAAGVVVTVAVLALLYYFRAKGSARRPERAGGFRKIMVATVNQPFDPEALQIAARMAGGAGIVETVYMIEIPLNRPLESGAGEEVAAAMQALEKAAEIASGEGVMPLPRVERTRMGSKTVVEMQRTEDFDAVVLDIHPGKRSERVGRRIAEYVQDHASCVVVVVSELEE